jgi:hypothetical protein
MDKRSVRAGWRLNSSFAILRRSPDGDLESKMRAKFSLVRGFALALLFAGCVFVFFTENTRWWTVFNFAASLCICFNLYVSTSPPNLSLLHPGDHAKPKLRPNLLMGSVFALLFTGYGFSSRIRLSALMLLSALCLAAFDPYRRTNANSVAHN